MFCNLYLVGSTVVSNLLIKVTSVDSKDRHIIQGYGAMPIPDQPGYYQETLPTWCPEQSPMHKMKSFFLGGSPELQDLKYIRDTDIKVMLKWHCSLRVLSIYLKLCAVGAYTILCTHGICFI